MKTPPKPQDFTGALEQSVARSRHVLNQTGPATSGMVAGAKVGGVTPRGEYSFTSGFGALHPAEAEIMRRRTGLPLPRVAPYVRPQGKDRELGA